MIFPWEKNRVKEKIFFNKNNHDLIIELKEKGIINKNILSAIKKVPRELFVSKTFAQSAYENMALPADCKQTISQPYVVAYMIDCLKLKKIDKVLEIGTGTGYQTAIISYLCQKIYTIEIFLLVIPFCLSSARRALLFLLRKIFSFALFFFHEKSILLPCIYNYIGYLFGDHECWCI